jgi:hypothetical protein
MELRIVGVRDAELLGHDNWMLRLRVKPDAADAVARALARRADTSWIGLTSGGTEIICSTSFSSAGEHEELIPVRAPEADQRTDSGAPLRRDALEPADEALLRALERDGRAPLAEPSRARSTRRDAPSRGSPRWPPRSPRPARAA